MMLNNLKIYFKTINGNYADNVNDIFNGINLQTAVMA